MTAESAGADPLLGRVVGGKFRVARPLGAGAMGKVYLAEQTNLGRKVAVKVLHANLAGDPSLEKRFAREARAASMLSHPNILQTVDFGNDDGLLYIAMELLDGRDLRRVIRDEWPFQPERLAHIVGQILSALDEAHAKGVVHRDLKPENVMLIDARGEPDFVKVCDFGIAKVTSERDSEGSALTTAGLICGTPEYMSPEQARGDALDGRSDLYAAAVMLYYMVAGELPFRAESALGVVTKHLTEAPVAPSVKRPDKNIPPALDAVILRGLEKSRDKRFANALDMKSALYEAVGLPPPRSSTSSPSQRRPDASDLATAATGVATPVPDGGAATVAAKRSTKEQSAAPAVAPPRSRAPLVGALAVVCVGLCAGGYLLVGKKPPPLPPPPLTLVLASNDKPAQPAAATAPPAAQATAPVAAPAAPVAAPPAPVAAPAAPVAAPAATHARHHAAQKGKEPVAAPSHEAVPSAPAAPAATAAPARTFATVFAEADGLFKAGDVTAALSRYEEAAKLGPGEAKTERQIGRCYMRLGDHDRGAQHLSRYLELAPDASDAAFIRAQIK